MNHNIIPFPVIETTTHIAITKVPALLSKLAYGLMFKLFIKPDMSLVSVLGNGSEHSNHEALITWLTSQYCIDEIETMHQPLEHISSDLNNYLNDQLTNMEDALC